MSAQEVTFSAPLQRWTNEAESSSVAFVVLTGEAADALTGHEIMRRLELGKRRGFGSVKVEAGSAMRAGRHPASRRRAAAGFWQ